MKKLETVKKAMSNDINIMKYLNQSFINEDELIKDFKAYIKAIKQGRMICNIEKVSASGMSRNIKFMSCENYKSNFNYRSYYSLFIALGFTRVRDTFRIGSCGMDMIFHTNYTIIHKLYRLGLISKNECSKLAQMTPTVI